MITQEHIETVLGAALANLGHPICNASFWKEELGDTLDEATIVAECEKLQNVTLNPWSSIRSQRNQLLAQSDWTQLADAPLTQEQKNAWSAYRQALRDVPSSAASPEEVVWPTAPV